MLSHRLVFLVALPAALPDSIWIQGDAVGTSCYSDKGCEAHGARCFNAVCSCLSIHVNVNGKCMPKVRPGHSPCVHDKQCEAVWPATRCINSICQCREGIHVKTRDGIVCVEYESCPLGGAAAVLRDANGTIASCQVSLSGLTSGCQDQLHMYDCIKDKRQDGHFYCCPNKANACSQPLDRGQLPEIYPELPERATTTASTRFFPWYLRSGRDRPVWSKDMTANRWFFNQLIDDCVPFTHLGDDGNANSFKTQKHCENYCKPTCLRGNPMFQKGPDGNTQQYAQRQQLCNEEIGCADSRYSCDVLQPGIAMCCPTKDFICSEFGGTSHEAAQGPYDEGIFCGQSTETVPRFYYDKAEKECKSFAYKGCSGNFNNFKTGEDCRNFCIQGKVYRRSQKSYRRGNVFEYIWPSRRRYLLPAHRYP